MKKTIAMSQAGSNVRWAFVLLFLFVLPFGEGWGGASFAYGDNHHIGARSAGLGNASVTLTDLWAAHHNQAGLAYVENISAGIFYESRFSLSELGLKGGVFALPVKGGVIGVSAFSFGYSNYSESKYGLAYARKFGDNFSVGIQLDYLHTRIAENYGSKGSVAGEIGLRAQLLDNLTLGAHVFNLSRTKLADFDNERIPTIMRVGLDYKFSDKVFLAFETEKDIDQKVIVKTGLEYHILEMLYLRAGVASNPFVYSFGFGLDYKGLRLDIASSVHPVLGYSPQVALSYRIE